MDHPDTGSVSIPATLRQFSAEHGLDPARAKVATCACGTVSTLFWDEDVVVGSADVMFFCQLCRSATCFGSATGTRR